MEEALAKDIATISDKEFHQISRLIYEKIGINLPETKKTLLIVRLSNLVKELGFMTFGDYYDYLQRDQSGEALSDLATRISTNYTFFYREPQHFDIFTRRVLPDIDKMLRSAGSNKIRVWCAGCSSGEEPYVLAMLMKEYYGAAYGGLDAGVLATDISMNMLKTAKEGVYAKESIFRLPEPLQKRYFKPMGSDLVRVNDELRQEVTIRRYNIVGERVPFNTHFHAIFCRNVMIYFDRATRGRVVEKLKNLLVPGGYLFVGHSEAVDHDVSGLKAVAPAAYMRTTEGNR